MARWSHATTIRESGVQGRKARSARRNLPTKEGGHESLPQAMTRGCGDAHARDALHGCTRREGAALIGKCMVQTRAITRPL